MNPRHAPWPRKYGQCTPVCDRTLLREARRAAIFNLMDWTHRIAGLMLVTLLPAVAGASAPKGMVEVREEILDNGLKVLLLENHRSPAVTFQVWYRVGSRNEVDGKSGLAHFLEHMLFKGTDKVAAEEYSRIIRKHGGRSNAFTSHDATVYHATMSRDTIAVAIEMEADRMVNTRFEEVYFTPEKKVVQEERRMRTDDRPRAALAEITNAVTYAVHPYRRPIIGWPEDVRRMTLSDLQDFYRTYYSPNNAFIVVAGDFDSEEILTRIRETFGKIPRGPEPPSVGLTEPPQQGERRVSLKKEAELPVLIMNYHAPGRRARGQLRAGRAGDDPVPGTHLAALPGSGLRPAHRPLGLRRLPPGLHRPHHLHRRRPGHAGQGDRRTGGRHRRSDRRGPGKGRSPRRSSTRPGTRWRRPSSSLRSPIADRPCGSASMS